MLYPEREYIQSVRGPSLSGARRVSSREGLSSRREPSPVFLVVLAPLPPRLHSWGSQLDLAEGMQTGESLSSSSPAISTAHSGIGSPFCGLFPSGSRLGASPIFLRADYSPLQSLQYEELLEVVTRSVCQVKHWLARRERLCFSGFSLAILLYWGLLGRSSPCRVPAPHTGRFRNRGLPLVLPCSGTEVDDALKSRGLLRRGSIWGSCFSLESGPDIHSSGLLRAAPTGEERGALHYMVSISPQRPLEIVLPALPEFQGAAVSRECFSQFFLPGIVAELRALPPLRGPLEQLLRLYPAGLPLQGTKLAAPSKPEASLERLVPLVHYLAAWTLLPNVSRWVLQTVEKGYRIQFGALLPPFKGIFLTLVSSEQALVLEQEVITLLRKEAIEVVPPLDRESGFYSWYFIVPKKDGGCVQF